MAHFEKHWDAELQKEVLTLARNAVCCFSRVVDNSQSSLTSTKFKERYEQLQTADALSSKSSTTHVSKRQKTHGLLRDNDSDESDDNVGDSLSPSWMIEFKCYIDTNDLIPPGMTVVEWWGVRILCCKLTHYGLIVTEVPFSISSMLLVIRLQLLLPVITLLSWHLQYRASVHSLLQALP
jgi:hypothetical protein